MASIHPDVMEAIDQIDAAVFSGDTFANREGAAKLQLYIDRWQRQLDTSKRHNYDEDPQQAQQDSMHACAECGSFDCNGECMEIP